MVFCGSAIVVEYAFGVVTCGLVESCLANQTAIDLCLPDCEGHNVGFLFVYMFGYFRSLLFPVAALGNSRHHFYSRTSTGFVSLWLSLGFGFLQHLLVFLVCRFHQLPKLPFGGLRWSALGFCVRPQHSEKRLIVLLFSFRLRVLSSSVVFCFL